MRKRSYAIIGTGAVGGLYGARFQQAGHDVHFLARGDAGRPLETEYIYRRPLAAARAAGADLPRIESLAAELEFLDAHNPRREGK